jgi:hypothetical protein
MRKLISTAVFIFLLVGCAGGPPKTLKDAQTIIFTLGYEGEIKALDQVITIINDTSTGIHEIEGKSSMFGLNYREIKIMNWGRHVARYMHFPPGKTKTRIYFNDGVFSAGDGFQKIYFDIEGKPGDIFRISHQFADSGRRGGIKFSLIDASKEREVIQEHFLRVVAANKEKQ